MIAIQIVGSPTGEPTGIENEYVVSYDPSAQAPDADYPTGILVTTPDLAKARLFPDVAEAIEFYRQSHGDRPDGRPNRPLTAFSVCFTSSVVPTDA